MADEIDWDEVGEIISSGYRVSVLSELESGPATPSQIADRTGDSPPHVSRALQHLRERELVDLLVAEDRKKGRLYGLTDKGSRVWGVIEEQNLASQ